MRTKPYYVTMGINTTPDVKKRPLVPNLLQAIVEECIQMFIHKMGTISKIYANDTHIFQDNGIFKDKN